MPCYDVNFVFTSTLMRDRVCITYMKELFSFQSVAWREDLCFTPTVHSRKISFYILDLLNIECIIIVSPIVY